MIRKVIKIDEKKCNGCGLCASACEEGAIGIVDGKARLLRDDYCDGLGNCLPACPMNAISFEEREAAAYSKKMEDAHPAPEAAHGSACGCPGSRMRTFSRSAAADASSEEEASELRQWPVQIKLVPVRAPYFDGADLLIAADCTAYAYAGFHRHFIRNHVTLIGCPKLDSVDYAEKLTEIFRQNRIQSVRVVRMSVPCCGGLEAMARRALAASGKQIPLQVTVISPDGEKD